MHAHDRSRLVFLDWVRILAFFLLIAYHVGMYYVSWDWHTKSPHAGTAIEPLMLLSSPWRLGLLFLVSGAATAFMLARFDLGAFVRRRTVRLLLPLLFGMFVIVPPQAYVEAVEQAGYAGSYAAFMRLYVSGYGGFCDGDGCLDLPTWNHLWFVAYLWVYTLAFAGLAALAGRRLDAPARRLAGLLHGWKLIALPVALLAAARILLLTHFPQTHGLDDDWYNHALYFTLFLLGALFARHGAVWKEMEALRWPALATALACWAGLVVYFSLPETLLLDPAHAVWRAVQRAGYALCQWTAIVAACGFARRHLQADGPARRYLTQAVFPVYIAHQTLIVVLAHAIQPARIAPAAEGLVLMVLTLALSFGFYELVRRCGPLRPLFGLPLREREGAPASMPATA